MVASAFQTSLDGEDAIRTLAVGAEATDIVALTLSDSVADPSGPFRGIVFATAGIIKITTHDGSHRVIPSGVLAAGVIHPIRFTRVWLATTTALNIWGVV